MELQALLILCGVGVAGVAVVLLMGLFSASGTSYEEAIAQQRRAATELLALAEGKNKPKKSNKKANKKIAKKEKKEALVTTGSEVESEAPAESGMEDDPAPGPKPHVEFSPPVVVDVQRDNPPNVKSQPEKKEEIVEKKEVKPVKQVKSAKSVGKAAPEPAKEESSRERHNSGDGPKEQRKPKKVEKKQVSEEVVTEEITREEVVPPLNTPQPSELTTEKLLRQVAAAPVPSSTASPPAGKNKKKKAEPNVLSLMAAGDGGGVNVGELVRVVREAALSRTEIQILTDALLNKHHDPLPEHSEWTEGPNDPMQKLKKQLADKEKALADEIEASHAMHAKLKELRANLNLERTRAVAAGRAAEAGAAAARAELHTHQARLQRLLDDNHALANEKLLLQSKLSAEGEVQAQRVQMEMHIQRLSESEAALVQQLNALQAELNARVLEMGQARCEANAARDGTIMAQQHATELAQQLQEATRAYAELEQQRQCAAHADQMAQQELRQAQEELKALNDLKRDVQRLTSRAQAAESTVEKTKEESEKQKEAAEKQKQQLSNELASLKEQMALRESELAELKQMKAVPAQNGLPLSNAEQHKSPELAKVESMVESLRGELVVAQSCNVEQRDQLQRLQEQLVQYQDRNNELRTKNWKIMEALQSAEKALQTKSASALSAEDSLREAVAKSQESHYNEVATLLRAACPAAAPGSAANSDWLQTFANNLKKELEKKESEMKKLEKLAEKVETVPDPRVDDLTSQNEHLQALVDKYKRIIDDTEGVLSRLQQNVTTEEQRWAQQLADKQRELDDVRQRTVMQMQKKIDALQEELQQVQGGNHNHTLADAERLTEERLMMTGLSDKHNVDVCNGPLQVGLEEK